MSQISEQVAAVLNDGSLRLQRAAAPGELANYLERLAGQVHQPCVVAVVGRVKAGKSTFINALLGDDLARVGTTETTATINYFCYGIPHPERPVICHWSNGAVENVSRGFVDGLQGNDLETLRRADGIHHLEYRLLNPYLERVTLVDTPGTGAIVEEHQNRTAEYMQLYSQLRDRHSQETQQIGRDADAVIYLVGQATASTTDRDFLLAFEQLTQDHARALNAIGVLAKVDLHPGILERRYELSNKIAGQFKESLNTVIPVSAGIHRALDGLLRDGPPALEDWMSAVRAIPPNLLDKMLSNEELYYLDYPDCQVGVEEREKLLGDVPWTAFTTMAGVAADTSLTVEGVEENLRTLAGFDRLRDVLERHFLQRSGFLRSYRIVMEARQALSAFKYSHLADLQQHSQADQARLADFVAFVRQAQGDEKVRLALEAYLTGRMSERTDLENIEKAVLAVEEDLSWIFHQLVEYNKDFEALQLLQEHPGSFSDIELDELRAFLGLYGTETEKRLPPGTGSVEDYVQQKQQEWREKQWHQDTIRASVAQRAVSRLGLILAGMHET